jgi:predicted HTH transcriptional regulator
VRLDYKREITGNEGEKKELAKDVSAMANSQGGHIIIGIDEKDQSPVSPPYGTPPIINRQNASEWIVSNNGRKCQRLRPKCTTTKGRTRCLERHRIKDGVNDASIIGAKTDVR